MSKRLEKELLEIKKNENISIEVMNASTFKVTIKGQQSTPYVNGIFHLLLEFKTDYPFTPPTLLFNTPIYHPNIHKTGIVCLDILKENWSPAMNLQKIFQSLFSLLAEPNPKNPLQPEIADIYLTNKEVYLKNAIEHTKKYSNTIIFS